MRREGEKLEVGHERSAMMKRFVSRCCSVITALLIFLGPTSFAAEKLVGLQSAPSIAMAVPWFAEEARLYPKYDLDFQLVYIASSGIVTAAMSGAMAVWRSSAAKGRSVLT